VRQLDRAELLGDARRAHLYRALLDHPGIGLLLTRAPDGVHAESAAGHAVIANGEARVLAGENPLERYGVEPHALRAVERVVRQPNAGDVVLFGAYDGYDIVSFDDQVGAHGSTGGDQTYPFLLAPRALHVDDATLEDARDIHRVVLRPYAEGRAG
jgi:hypothetical protein